MMAALSQLADTYLSIADKAAAEALAAFRAQLGPVAAGPFPSSQEGAQASSVADTGVKTSWEASKSGGPSTGQQPGSGAKDGAKQQQQRYPDHVHDPLKVHMELGNTKGAALQCVTELYRGLLYVVLYHCHRQARP